MNIKYNIGEKIKNRRKQLNLTQKEVSSDFITRNMLSLIESGVATPSFESAEYICKKLGMPLSYLFSEESNLSVYEKKQFISLLKQSYKESDYERCLELLKNVSDPDDEINYIHAFSAFYRAKELVNSGAFESAEKCLKTALEKSSDTIYNTEEINIITPLYLSIVSNVMSPLLELEVGEYEERHKRAYDYELFKYVSLDFEYDYQNKIFEKHLEAKKKLKIYDYFSAINLLKEIEDLKSTEYNAYVFFGVYTDLETSYKQIGDFENAYRYATKRIALMNAFKC